MHVPPAEYDPVTYEPLTEIVPVASVGTVVSWTWQPEPLAGQPLRPAVRVGADQARRRRHPAAARRRCWVGDANRISTGDRVHVHWADEPAGAITDIAYFALGDRPNRSSRVRPTTSDPVTMVVTPISIEIQHSASLAGERVPAGAAGGQAAGRAHAAKTARSTSRRTRADPATGTADSTEFVELPDKGTVTTFAIINIPFAGQRIKPPYVAAYVLLDGADIPFLHLVTEIDAAEVRMGMRVEAVWKPREEWGLGIDNIDHFRPTGEPDADYETYKHHL